MSAARATSVAPSPATALALEREADGRALRLLRCAWLEAHLTTALYEHALYYLTIRLQYTNKIYYYTILPHFTATLYYHTIILQCTTTVYYRSIILHYTTTISTTLYYHVILLHYTTMLFYHTILLYYTTGGHSRAGGQRARSREGALPPADGDADPHTRRCALSILAEAQARSGASPDEARRASHRLRIAWRWACRRRGTSWLNWRQTFTRLIFCSTTLRLPRPSAWCPHLT